jgi:hypothetical protein
MPKKLLTVLASLLGLIVFVAPAGAQTGSAPQWLSEGKPITAEPVTVQIAGKLTFDVTQLGQQITCKIAASEMITNPSGGAGTDELTRLMVSECSEDAALCPANIEVLATELPWHSELAEDSSHLGVSDTIDGVKLELRCAQKGRSYGVFAGSLSPQVGEGALEFDSSSGDLKGELGTILVTGTDKLTGPLGDKKITTSAPTEVPPPPATEGCYTSADGEWTSISCASEEYINKHIPHPELEDGIFSKPVELPPAAPSFVYGDLSLKIAKVGTEENIYTNPKTKVVTHTPNAWSIQNNAIFHGTNKNEDGIQFAEQAFPKSPVGICIWQVKITPPQKYPRTCATTSPLSVPLAAGDSGIVNGYTRAGGLLALSATVPGQPKVYGVVHKDEYGLAGRWQNATGSLLGYGESSEAKFSSAEIETFVVVETCQGEPGSATCPQEPKLKGHAYSFYNGQTGETNNLIPVIGSPPEHLPTLEELLLDEANIKYVSTTTGSCPSGSPPLCGLGNGNGNG